MKEYFYIGLFLVIIAGLAFVLVYKTDSDSGLMKGSSSLVTAEFGGVSLRIEVATTSASQERGLSGRGSIPSDYGMLFVFEKSDTYAFWMKDMLIPIDIFWLDDKGHVISIAENVATSSYPRVFYPNAPARYVLETVAGFARSHVIATGTPLVLKNFERVSE